MGFVLYFIQNKLLYFPTPNFSIPEKTLVFQNNDENISVIITHQGKKNALLYFGGNGESVRSNTQNIAQFFPNFTCYLLEYRGYGASSGKANEKTLYSDALKLYETIQSKHANIFLMGRSLGSGIATYVASQKKISKLVLVTPYDSIVNVAQKAYPIYPAFLLLKDQYNAFQFVKNIATPTLVIIAKEDKIIPFKNTQNLINSFKDITPKVVIIKQRNHHNLTNSFFYKKALRDFFNLPIKKESNVSIL